MTGKKVDTQMKLELGKPIYHKFYKKKLEVRGFTDLNVWGIWDGGTGSNWMPIDEFEKIKL